MKPRGDQTERYGYAAFGLVMSLFNLIGIVLTPDYSTVFMVEIRNHGRSKVTRRCLFVSKER